MPNPEKLAPARRRDDTELNVSVEFASKKKITLLWKKPQ